MTTKKPSDEAESTTAEEKPSETKSSSKSASSVPTDRVPGFMKPIYNTGPGKRVYEITSDPALFLRYGVVGAAGLGLGYTLFNVISVRGAGISTILTTLFFSLLVTLVATGVLYALREVVERSGTSK